jgi:putative peptide zinc metalloprotease protein
MAGLVIGPPTGATAFAAKAAFVGSHPASAPALPPLRDELMLHPGPPGADGAPSWTLEDPARGRYFRLGWAEIEMLARWDRDDPAVIAAAITQETTLTVGAMEVEAFIRFLISANLVRVAGPRALGQLHDQAQAARMNPVAFLLKNYLFIRIPLVRPDRFLDRTIGLAAPFFSPVFWIATLIAGLTGMLLVLRQWDVFVTTFVHLFSWQGLAAIGIGLIVAKIAHELAHAYAARREGLAVPTMGIALMVLYPVLYTDTTAAWRLTDRAKRLRIGYAGMAIELAIAAWMTLAWSFMPDGPVRSAAFILATTTWIMTLAVNLNPFMRFDGYFLFSDALDMPNLQDRAFRLARWRLREALFGFGESPPERFPKGRARILITYAVFTWIYRFVLFLGIALIVYHFFFKALGIILMIVELAWFIGRPILMELREWAERREAYKLNRNTLTTGAVLLGALVLFLMPLQWSIHAPALLRAERQSQIFAPADALLVMDEANPGREVAEGEVLFSFAAPDMEHRLAENARRIMLLRWRASVETPGGGVRGGSLGERAALWEELEGAVAERAGLLRQSERLTVSASHAGRLAERDPDIRVGDWVAEGEWLATLVTPESWIIEAYLSEADLGRVGTGARARFYPQAPGRPPLDALVIAVADTGSSSLVAAPELTSPHGGALPAYETADGLVPDGAVYRVVAHPDIIPAMSQPQALRGTLRLEGERVSAAVRVWRAIVAIVIRESGF